MRCLIALCALLFVAACGGADRFAPAPMAEVQRRAYVHDGPAQITLYTVIDVENGGGEHTALLINASQRVLWDPAGSFRHPHVPERGDLHYGITEDIRKAYIDYHVRDTHYVVAQTLTVTPAQAADILQRAAANGSASKATCARSTSAILSATGIDMGRTWFPRTLMRRFAKLPGVREETITQANVDTSHGVNFDPDYATPIPVY